MERFDPTLYDYGVPLLAHAKVYHLAHYKAIDPLRALALHHLLASLWRIDPVDPATGSHNIAGIAELAHYVYENTDHLDNNEEPLRRLVSDFIARNFSALESNSKMVDFLGEGGDVVTDVMRKVSRGGFVTSRSDSAARAPNRYVAKLFVSRFFARRFLGGRVIMNCYGDSSSLGAPTLICRTTTCTS